MIRLLNAFLWFFSGIVFSLPSFAGGKLLIVGGALESSNAEVYQSFIAAVPPQAKIAIIPAASGKPIVYAEQFQRDLMHYGVDRERIKVIPLAIMDDASTKADESLWQNNAYSDDVIASLHDVQGFWFVGGDQTRITQLLTRDGAPSPLLTAIRERLNSGAIIGGTSAGAAIMSAQMIAGGDSVSALLAAPSKSYSGTESQELGALYWQPGLNFLPNVLVDQHFDRKARLGRLAVAMCRLGETQGLGVDENTAALIDLENAKLTVLGQGNVVWLDGRQQTCSLSQSSAGKDTTRVRAINGFLISVFAAGDTWQWQKKSFQPYANKVATVGQEAFTGAPHIGGGFGIANARLDESLGFDLLDNKDAQGLERLTLARFNNLDYLIRYNFKQTSKSQGYWGYLDGTKDSYSVVDVNFSIDLRRLSERILR